MRGFAPLLAPLCAAALAAAGACGDSRARDDSPTPPTTVAAPASAAPAEAGTAARDVAGVEVSLRVLGMT